MNKDVSLKVSKILQEIDATLNEALKHDILPDRTYTQIITQIGNIDDIYINDQLKLDNNDYHHWVKLRLEKISSILINLQKHSTTSFSIPNEDLMHVTGDYYNEDNSTSLTKEAKHALSAIISEQYNTP